MLQFSFVKSITLVAIAIVSQCSSTIATPNLLDSIDINGWYNCTAWTLEKSFNTDNIDYLETSTSKSHKASKMHTLHHTKDYKSPYYNRKKMPWSLHYGDDAFNLAHKRHKERQAKLSKDKEDGNDEDIYLKHQYECAEIHVPMCYEEICESDKMIDLFVKRIKAPESEDIVKKSLWVLQGGPGASSAAMEELMETTYLTLKGEVSIYTMDHRGVGRSERLECQAAEAETLGSPEGLEISMTEVQSCIDDVMFKIENQTAAFSVTSAATDLKTIIDKYLADEDVYVYALSYGTYVVERLMHLAPESVKGYIIDGIVSEEGHTPADRSTYTNWDRDVGSVGDKFFKYCQEDESCISHFPLEAKNDLIGFLHKLYNQLDEDAETPGVNECADAIMLAGYSSPSHALSQTLMSFMIDDYFRPAIPAVVARAARCSPDDVNALSFMMKYLYTGDGSPEMEDLLFMSPMLYSLIVYSEMWESPSPTKETMVKWFEDGLMGGENYTLLPYYCVFTGAKEKACEELINLPKIHSTFVYKKDKYWNKTAKIPKGSTALLFNGGLDVQAVQKYGKLEAKYLKGPHMMVDFEYASHCTTFSSMVTSGPTCAVQILTSYIQENGVLENVNTDCMNDLVPLDLHGHISVAEELFGTEDTFD